MDRRLRSIVTVLSVTALMIVALLIILAYEFPSPGDVRRTLLDYRLISGRAPPTMRPLAEEPSSESRSTGPPPSPTPAPTPEEQIAAYIIDRVLRGNDGTPRVCENLDNVEPGPIADRRALMESLTAIASGEAGTNAYVESVLAPLEVALQKPAVAELMNQVANIKATGTGSSLAAEELNTLLARASSDLYANKAEIEQVATHAYHLYVIARAMRLNPNLATNPEALEFCNIIQSAIANPGEGTPIDHTSEKAAMLRFLAFAGIAPEQVQYDPDLSSAIRFEATSKSLELKIPWIEKIFPAADAQTRTSGAPGTALPLFAPEVPGSF